MIEKILEFMKTAGEIAVKYQDELDLSQNHSEKSECIWDQVTEGDVQISQAFRKFAQENFSDLNYVLLDEETCGELGDNALDKIKKAEYTLVIDPIDGTQTYSLKLPMYGISVGILKKGRPYAGAIYCPNINELVYCDGKSSYWVTKAFSKDEKKIKLVKKDIDSKAVVLMNNWVGSPNNNYDGDKVTVNDYYSMVFAFLCVATGRARGTYFCVKPWDLAGAWSILRNLGFEMYGYDTLEPLKEVSSDTFADNWKPKEVYICCKNEDFDYLRKIIDIRK